MTNHYSHVVTPEVQEFLIKIRDFASTHKVFEKYLGDVDELIKEEDGFQKLYVGHNNLYAVVDMLRTKRPDLTGTEVFNELIRLRNNGKISKYSDAFSQNLETALKSSMPAFALIAGAALVEIENMKANQKGAEIAAQVEERGDFISIPYRVLEDILGTYGSQRGNKWPITEHEIKVKVEKELADPTKKEKKLFSYLQAIALLADVKDLPISEIRNKVADSCDKKYRTRGGKENTIRQRLETLNTMAADIIIEVVHDALTEDPEYILNLLTPGIKAGALENTGTEIELKAESFEAAPVTKPAAEPIVPAEPEIVAPVADLVAVAIAAQEAAKPEVPVQVIETRAEQAVPTLEKRLRFVKRLRLPEGYEVEAGIEKLGDRTLSYVEF